MEFDWGGVMKHNHLNYIVLSDGVSYRVFERLGKDVPFEAYNKDAYLGIGDSPEDAVSDSGIPTYEVELKSIEVIFNE